MSNQPLVIPQELKSPTKIFKWVNVSDLIFIVLYFMCFKVLEIFVDSRLYPVYYIFNVFIAVILTMPSRYNVGKKVYHSLIYMLSKDRTVYHSISPPELPVIRGETIGKKTIKIEKNIYQIIAEKPLK